MNRNVVLTGFMGTGKSAAGQIIAKKLGLRFIDIDAEIERTQGITINEIFALHGEEFFRDLESAVIDELSKAGPAVIATGGGAVLREENMRRLRENGIVVCLMAEPEIIFSRVGKAGNRPLLKTDDAMTKIKEMLKARSPYYNKADIIIDTGNKTPLETAEEVIQQVKDMVS
ncbi:MAG: shikimate kinase [Nitrospiraceae bacterium]|nr:shikimate kinase [Nitrospiraceae bacterium]